MFGRGHATSAPDAVALVAGGTLLVDVREPGEFSSGHASGGISAPLGQLDQQVPRLATAGPVLAICASGIRSRTATRRLRAAGVDGRNVKGGLRAWRAVGGPMSPGSK
jgi:rhodanese-related sulfurtransferase